MSQASEDTRAYSSWNRTPGKPNNSSNYLNTKMSNISSSTDSGVGRTPNWNSDTDCKFGLMESNPWSNNNVIQSPDSSENSKKLSWDENNSKMSNNLTFGFSSQWSVGNDVPISANNNPTWGLPPTSPGDYITNEPTKLDSCWNTSSCQSGDNYMHRATSIWSSSAQRPYSDQDSDHNTTTASTVDLSGSHKSLATTSKLTPNVLGSETEKCDMSMIGTFNGGDSIEKNTEPQTWAQAAGKGLQSSSNSDEDGVVKREIDEQYETIINRIDGWGSHTVDQSTPWVVDDVDLAPLSTSTNEKLASLARSAAESNVWTNEPPNGVGVWESHYENIGEKTSRWSSAGVVLKPKPSWEIPEPVVSGQWGERDCDSCVWNPSSNVATEPRVKPAWIGGMAPGPKQEQQSTVAPIGSGSRVSTQNFPLQRNSNALVPGMSGPIPSDLSEPLSRQSFYQNQNINMMTNNNNNRPNPNLKVRPIMNIGYRKDDAQGALFNNGMDMNRAMNQSSLNNQSNLIAQRNDWNMGPEHNFRSNPVDMDNYMMGGSSYMQPPLPANPMMKQQHIMQQMQQMTMGNRQPSEHQLLLEKQIMKEISQLQVKQQELMQRITGLRSIAGSQVIIQEMSRTLTEVHQQLSTQQTTLKVIRNQMPNGGMGGGGNGGNPNAMASMAARSMQPGQQGPSQSGILSDLSMHMNDMKLQSRIRGAERSLDLWPQGSLPSPSTMSPYAGMDGSKFYGSPGGGGQQQPQMNGPPPPFGYGGGGGKQPGYQHHRGGGGGVGGPQMWAQRALVPPQSGPGDGHLAPAGEDADGTSDSARNNNSVNNATTTALSLSQALSSGTGAASAFTSRDISFASANISEFVPGQPWPGISYSQRDDPNITLGTGQRGLLSVTNDHLEKLANSNVNSPMNPNDGVNSNMGRVPTGANGGNQVINMTYVLIRDLPSHINIEMLKNVLTSQSFPGLIQMHPNLAARWVLLHFTSNEETLKAFKNLYGKVGAVELVPDQEVSQRIQYNSGCTVGPVISCSGVMDFHPQSQSHFLH